MIKIYFIYMIVNTKIILRGKNNVTELNLI